MERLTDTQRQLAESHHRLVYSFLNKHYLNPEDWYDVVIFGYLQAVANYDPQRGSLTSFAWLNMQSSVKKELTYRNRSKRKGVVVSLDDCGPLDDNMPLHECIGVLDQHIERMDFDMAETDRLMDQLTDKQKKIVKLRAQGLSFQEIAQKVGLACEYTRKQYHLATAVMGSNTVLWMWTKPRKQLCKKLLEEGRTHSEIAETLGCREADVAQHAAGLRVKPTMPVTETPIVVPQPKSDVDYLIQDAQSMCREAWKVYIGVTDSNEFAFVFGQLQARLDMAAAILRKSTC